MDCIAEKAHDWKALTPLSRPHRPEHDGCSCSKADGHEHEHTNLQRLKGLGITPAHGAPKRSSTLCPAASPTRADGTGFVTGAMTIGSSFAGAQAPTCTCARGGPPQRWTTSVSTRSAQRATRAGGRYLLASQPPLRGLRIPAPPTDSAMHLSAAATQPPAHAPAASSSSSSSSRSRSRNGRGGAGGSDNAKYGASCASRSSNQSLPMESCRLSLSCRQRHHQYLNQHSSGHKLRLYTQRHLHLHGRRRHGSSAASGATAASSQAPSERRHGRDTRRHHSQHHRFGSTSLRTRSKQICEE